MRRSIIVILLLCSQLLSAQEIKKERFYEGEALYGYMNGGSDLYLEYGFRSLKVLDISFEGYDYMMEIFTMDNPTDAFGIYSIHIFKPVRVDSLLVGTPTGGYDCLSKYQLQAVSGCEYISIIFNSGAKAAPGAEKLLSQHLSDKAADAGDSLPLSLPADLREKSLPLSGILKYARGPLGLAKIDEDLIETYPEIGQYGLWIFSLGDPAQQIIQSEIAFCTE